MWKFEFQELATRLPDVVDKKVVIIWHFTQHAASCLRTVSLYQSTYHRQVSARADTSFATEATHFHAGYDPADQKSQFRAQIQAIIKVTVQLNGVRTLAITEINGGVGAQFRALHLTDTHIFKRTPNVTLREWVGWRRWQKNTVFPALRRSKLSYTPTYTFFHNLYLTSLLPPYCRQILKYFKHNYTPLSNSINSYGYQ